MTADPPFADGVLVQVRASGGAAMGKRQEVFQHLASAVDAARQETGDGEGPPELAAQFVLGAIEAAAVNALTRDAPQGFAKAVPRVSGCRHILRAQSCRWGTASRALSAQLRRLTLV
jgi:hypothetical protein